MKKLTTTIMFMLSLLSFSQEEPIDLVESSMQLSFEEEHEFFFSFQEGDEIILDFNLIKGKHLKEIEIIELPSTKKFSAFKTKKITNKRIKVSKKAVYMFRFYSSSITNRAFSFKIQRVPEGKETKPFNTDWKWKTLRDTTYVAYQEDSLIGYDTIVYEEVIKELKHIENEEIMILEKSQRVHSCLNENPSKTYLRVDLPSMRNSEFVKEKMLGWAYWIGVDQEAREAYKESMKIVGSGVSEIVRYRSPLAAIITGKITELAIPKIGEDVQYYFITDYQNAQQYLNDQSFLQFDMGKGKAAYARSDINRGTFYIGLENDNKIQGIDVDIKIAAIKEIKTYENVTYKKERQQPKYQTLNKTRMEVKETKIRIPVE